ncbi:response regulator transcription factor [Paraburkholderia sp. BR10923]|uniref:response regulator transcription factor n=1 Tax=Paraburkholderia sp. BR10923 TaxID=3236992 RepID=UPI0034CD4E86
MQLLLMGKDESIALPAVDTLRRAGHIVDWMSVVGEPMSWPDCSLYDLVMLDPDLSGIDVIDALKRYRECGGHAFVIIVTAQRELETCIAALDAGADDYLVKPFDVDELAARVRALTRRRVVRTVPVLAYDGLMLDAASHRVTLHGEPLTLAPRGFALLQALIEDPARVFTRSELEARICDPREEIASNAIEVQVCGLRQKIGAGRIVTVRGAGYCLRTPDSKVRFAG